MKALSIQMQDSNFNNANNIFIFSEIPNHELDEGDELDEEDELGE